MGLRGLLSCCCDTDAVPATKTGPTAETRQPRSRADPLATPKLAPLTCFATSESSQKPTPALEETTRKYPGTSIENRSKPLSVTLVQPGKTSSERKRSKSHPAERNAVSVWQTYMAGSQSGQFSVLQKIDQTGAEDRLLPDLPSWSVSVKKLSLVDVQRRKMQPELLEQVKMNRERLKDMKQDDAPAVYVIGQVSLQELQSYFQEYRGSIFFVQGLSGFNVVDLSCDGQLIEASRNAALKLCEKCDCLLLNLTAKDCIKVGFDRLYQLFESCVPEGFSKDVLYSYRASSFGSFAASVSRGKIKVTAEDGAATDGLIRSVDVSIGETVEKLRNFEVKLYRDAMALCKDDAQKQSIFQHVLGAVEINSSETPEDYLTERTKGFGVPEAFIQMRNNCSPEITAAAYLPGGVLDGCVTPVYDDWTIHQALRILAGMQPLDKESNKMVELHLTLLSECIKFVFAIDESPGDYCSELFGRITKRRHLVLHDVGSDTGPDDFPACLLLMALVKFKPDSGVRLLAVGGEPKYRTLRTNLMRHLCPRIPGVTLEDAPFLQNISFPSPFVPVALVQTMSTLPGGLENLPNGHENGTRNC